LGSGMEVEAIGVLRESIGPQGHCIYVARFSMTFVLGCLVRFVSLRTEGGYIVALVVQCLDPLSAAYH
jgi:hypothetical protein